MLNTLLFARIVENNYWRNRFIKEKIPVTKMSEDSYKEAMIIVNELLNYKK